MTGNRFSRRDANVGSGYTSRDYEPRDGRANFNNDFDVESCYLSEKNIFFLYIFYR